MTKGPLEPRRLAAHAVGRVLRSGAYSNVVLDSIVKDLPSGDAARVKALAFGVLRRLERLDSAIEDAAGRPLHQVDKDILDRLRLATFELMYSETPTPVAVNVGVDLVKELKPKAGGFANAVLRDIAGRDGGPPELDLPSWLRSELGAHWSSDWIDAFARDSGSSPPRIVRYRGQSHESGTPVAGVPGAFEVSAGPLPEGAIVQDAASIAVGHAVGAKPGMVVVDVGAAPGGKTAHLLDQVGADGGVVAVDRHPRRARDGRRRVRGAAWVVADGRRLPLARRRFDRVLLDAPCTGLGTMRRRPEVRIRVADSDVQNLASLQAELLESALELLAPGGRLVYSVCTVTPRETVDVVAPYEFRPGGGPGEVWGKGRLMAPHLTGTDGMFIAVHDA